MCESERNDDASVEGAGTPLKRQLFYGRMIRGSADLGMCEAVFLMESVDRRDMR